MNFINLTVNFSSLHLRISAMKSIESAAVPINEETFSVIPMQKEV